MSDSARFESTYAEYNKVLRTWFVAFGVGAPGTLILSDESKNLLSQTSCPSWVVGSLALGVVLQVFVAGMNKYVAWCNAFVELHKEEHSNPELEYAKVKKNHPIIFAVSNLTEKKIGSISFLISRPQFCLVMQSGVS